MKSPIPSAFLPMVSKVSLFFSRGDRIRTRGILVPNVCLNLPPALYRPLWPFPLLQQFLFDTLLACVFQIKLSPFGMDVGLDSVY